MQPLPLGRQSFSVARSSSSLAPIVVLPVPTRGGWEALEQAVRAAFSAVLITLPSVFHIAFEEKGRRKFITCGRALICDAPLFVLDAVAPGATAAPAAMDGIPQPFHEHVARAMRDPGVLELYRIVSAGKLPHKDIIAAAQGTIECCNIYIANREAAAREGPAPRAMLYRQPQPTALDSPPEPPMPLALPPSSA